MLSLILLARAAAWILACLAWAAWVAALLPRQLLRIRGERDGTVFQPHLLRRLGVIFAMAAGICAIACFTLERLYAEE